MAACVIPAADGNGTGPNQRQRGSQPTGKAPAATARRGDSRDPWLPLLAQGCAPPAASAGTVPTLFPKPSLLVLAGNPITHPRTPCAPSRGTRHWNN